ncbi:MAG TPA: hypothetical protein VKD91_17535 [Pyrinomonadaceae bacterium]|nr:hypothetical protein [Pyrinomonadaceae bacterium]
MASPARRCGEGNQAALIRTKAAYLLAFKRFQRLVNLTFRGKIMAQFDRMNYGCPKVGNNIQSNQEIRAKKFV